MFVKSTISQIKFKLLALGDESETFLTYEACATTFSNDILWSGAIYMIKFWSVMELPKHRREDGRKDIWTDGRTDNGTTDISNDVNSILD